VRALCSANRKELILATKKNLIIVALFTLLGTALMAQHENQAAPELSAAQKTALLKEFTRSVKMDGIILNFVLLNNKTIDVLFTGEGKYAMRARANAATTFFVQGVPQKDITFDPRFVVEQDGKTFTGEAINLSNLQAGGVAKGARIAGLIQLGQKIDIDKPFKIKGAQNSSAEFKLSKKAIELLQDSGT
jgi:hypothetical protein